MSEDLGKWGVKTMREIEIKPITVRCSGVNHERILWRFSAYEIFEIVKNITKSENELAVMLGSPQEAIVNTLKVINRKYRAKSNTILSWKGQGFTKTQETYIRNHREGQAFEKIDSEGNVSRERKIVLKFDEMKDLTPQIQSVVVTEENIQHNHFTLQQIGDSESDVME